ncbi:MAG: hypothetical protein LBB98_09325, partial [Treponema sp.]|nr:hypothetical protein [Treponema sp.]
MTIREIPQKVSGIPDKTPSVPNNNEPPRRRAAGYRRFLREIFVYAGEHIPRTPSRKRPKGRG